MLIQNARIGWATMALLCMMPFLLAAEEPADKGLTKDQQKLQADLEHSLVAPCCWNMTVDQHDSQAARDVRQRITELIKAGKTRDEIINYFVSQPQYGERILASPAQDNLLGKAAYWLIPIAFLFGVFVVTKTIRSLAKPAAEKPSSQTSERQDRVADSWDQRVEEELKQYE